MNITSTWFVLRDLKRPNAKEPGYKLLENKGFEVFTPMKRQTDKGTGQQTKSYVPIIPDLLFVHSTCEELEPVLEVVPTLQFRFVKGGYRRKMVVSEADMNRFKLAVESTDSAEFYAPDHITPAMIGRKVRIIDGPLCGYEAPLLKIQGSKRKKILIELPTILCATIRVEPSQIVFVREAACKQTIQLNHNQPIHTS